LTRAAFFVFGVSAEGVTPPGGAVADPFQPITDLVVEFVDSAAGSRKTLTAVAVSLQRAREDGVRTLFAMPTLKLVEEMVEVARRPGDVPVIEITSREDEDAASRNKPRKFTTTALLTFHLTGKDAKDKPLKNHPGKRGHLVFITHETFLRMGRFWPPETAEFVPATVPDDRFGRLPKIKGDPTHDVSVFGYY
jgi:hypothetical protein